MKVKQERRKISTHARKFVARPTVVSIHSVRVHSAMNSYEIRRSQLHHCKAPS